MADAPKGIELSNVAIVGDARFTKAFQPPAPVAEQAALPEPAPAPESPPQVVVTVDKHGRIAGDTSHLDPHIVEQFADPEVQKKIAAIYRKNTYGGEEPMPEPRYLTKPGEQRNLARHTPPGTSRKDRRRLFRKMTKHALRSQRHEQPIDRSESGERNDQRAAGD